MVVGTIRALIAAAMVLAPAAAQAEWRKYDTTHFIIYSEAGEQEATRLAEGLETVDGLMRMAVGLRPDEAPVKVRIYQVAGETEVERALGLYGSGVAGFYDNNALGPFAVTPRRTSASDGLFTPDLVLHHEYAHHFMLQYLPGIYPSWYLEGFAELIGSSTMMKDGRIAYGMPAKHRGDSISADWVPLGELFTNPPEKVKDLDLYGQGWAMTHFFTFTPTRSGQLRQYLAGIAAGKSSAEAAKVFGNLSDLNREAHRYLDAGSFAYKPVTVPIVKPVIAHVEPVSAGEAALIPEIISFRDEDLAGYRKAGAREREQGLREQNIQRIRDKARRYASDPFALYFLAQAEYTGGHYKEAEEAADRLLALQPRHVRGMVVKSLCLSRGAKKLDDGARTQRAAEARRLALAANHADPDDALPLLAFYESYHLAGEAPPKQAVTGLITAFTNLPHDSHVRLLLVDELASERRWREAIAVLMPIANDPHDSPQRASARERLSELQAHAQEGAAPAAG